MAISRPLVLEIFAVLLQVTFTEQVTEELALLANSFTRNINLGSFTGFKWIVPDRDEITEGFELVLHKMILDDRFSEGLSVTYHRTSEGIFEAQDILDDPTNELIILSSWKNGLIEINSTNILTSKVWLLFLQNEDEIEAMKLIFTPHLQLNSKLFFVLLGEDTQKSNQLWEAYSVSVPENVIVRVIGKINFKGINYILPRILIERRKDFGGHTFKVVYISSTPYVTVTENGTLAGFMMEVLNLLSKGLNFTSKFMEAESYGDRLGNGSWVGALGTLQRKEADFSCNDFSITEDRAKVVDFSMGIYGQNLQLFMRRPYQSVSWTTFLDSFNHEFWLFLPFVLIIISLLMHLTYFVHKHYDFKLGDNKEMIFTRHRAFLHSVASMCMALCALSVQETPQTSSSKMLFFTICLFGALVFWSYNATLVSLLSVDLFVLPIQNLEDLIAKPSYQLLVKEGTVSADYFSGATNLVERTIYEEQLKGNPNAYELSVEAIKNRMLQNSDLVFFATSDQAKLVLGDSYPCIIDGAAKRYFPTAVSFAFVKGSPFVEFFSNEILLLKQSGQVKKLIDKYLKSPNEGHSCDQSAFKEIKYENIFTAFLLLAIGIAVAWMIAGCERVRRKKRVI